MPLLHSITGPFFSPPIVADFSAHLFSKGVSFCVAVVGTFAAIISFRFVTVSSNFACWLEFQADLFQREVFPSVLLLVVYLLL